MAAARADWKATQAQLDPKRLVFIDETGTSTNMTRLRGRCRRGQRLDFLPCSVELNSLFGFELLRAWTVLKAFRAFKVAVKGISVSGYARWAYASSAALA